MQNTTKTRFFQAEQVNPGNSNFMPRRYTKGWFFLFLATKVHEGTRRKEKKGFGASQRKLTITPKLQAACTKICTGIIEIFPYITYNPFSAS
jgi:hypothetical protein